MRLIGIIFIILVSCSDTEIKLETINKKNYSSVMQANGKAKLINFWATWCQPCVEEFPAILELKEKYKDQLDVVFISLDFQEQLPDVKAFLRKMNYSDVSFIKDGPDEDLFNALPNDFSGAIPYTVIKNNENLIVSKLMGKHSKEQFEDEIKRAIK
jgi:thiol-disulfide isomerase/thioredoxin